jgi:hypothetical protein
MVVLSTPFSGRYGVINLALLSRYRGSVGVYIPRRRYVGRLSLGNLSVLKANILVFLDMSCD